MNRKVLIIVIVLVVTVGYVIGGRVLYHNNRAEYDEVITKVDIIKQDNGYQYEGRHYVRRPIGLMKRKWFANLIVDYKSIIAIDLIMIPYQWIVLRTVGLDAEKIGCHYTYPQGNLD